LSEADLLVFLEGDPGTAVATRVEQHIDTCAACFELLTLLSEELDARAQPDDSSPAPAPPEPLPWQRGSYINRFFVLDLLGVGGMGIVYAAFDPKLDRKVVLKVLRGQGAGSPAA
jgi:hypothetical protein